MIKHLTRGLPALALTLAALPLVATAPSAHAAAAAGNAPS
jgi:hypothetical protein